MWRMCCVLVAVAAAPADEPGETNPVHFPEGARAALEKAAEIEVLSLDPDGGEKSPDAFHEFKVLGRTTVKDEDARAALTSAVLKGVAASNGNTGRCFEPHHGLRAVYDGHTYDFVICFHCLQIQVYVGKALLDTTPTTTSARPTLNKILKEAGAPVEETRGK